MTVTVEVTGTAAVVDGLERGRATVRGSVGRALNAGLRRIRDRARAAAPSRSGRLRRSIIAATSSDALAQGDETLNGVGGVVGTPLFYAPWVHYGTRGVPARPFLAGPYDTEAAAIVRDTGDDVRAALR